MATTTSTTGATLTEKDINHDATQVAQKILCAVLKTGERYGTRHICDVLRGRQTKRVKDLKHEELSVFGVIPDLGPKEIRDFIPSLVGEKLLAKAEGLYPILKVTDEGHKFLKSPKKLKLELPKKDKSSVEQEETSQDLMCHQELFDQLRILRLILAQTEKKSAFTIFTDKSLEEMATRLPQDKESFLKIYGVSASKAEKYGEKFLKVIRNFAKKNNL